MTVKISVVAYEDFRQSMSNFYHQLPSEIQRDVKILFCPVRCLLHQVSPVTGRSSHAFGHASGAVVMFCYDSFAAANRFDNLHLSKVLLHEVEHVVCPDAHHHSEHYYAGCPCQKCQSIG